MATIRALARVLRTLARLAGQTAAGERRPTRKVVLTLARMLAVLAKVTAWLAEQVASVTLILTQAARILARGARLTQRLAEQPGQRLAALGSLALTAQIVSQALRLVI